MSSARPRIAVLVSGSGRSLENLQHEIRAGRLARDEAITLIEKRLNDNPDDMRAYLALGGV